MSDGSGDVQWVGLVHVALGIAAIAVFLAGDGAETGLLAGVALVGVGLGAIVWDWLGIDAGAIDPRLRGAFWVAVGGGVAALALTGAPTVGYLWSGLVLGAGAALYGLVLALER